MVWIQNHEKIVRKPEGIGTWTVDTGVSPGTGAAVGKRQQRRLKPVVYVALHRVYLGLE